MRRRVYLGFWLLLAAAGLMAAEPPLRIILSAPGPRNLSYLPVDLIPKIGADLEENAELQILHTGGGGVALKNLASRSADFVVAGLPAQMSARTSGGDVVTLAAVNEDPLFVLMVRGDLRNQVQRVADLKGRVLGVNTSTQSAKTTSQQLMELVLRSDGVKPSEVTMISAGQSWDEQSSVLASGTVDAVMGDEPFASRLRDAGQVFFLVHLADREASKNIVGARFLHAALATRSDVLARSPERVERTVRMVRRSLQWIASHTPEELVAKLEIADGVEQAALLRALKAYPSGFSKDGRLSSAQLKETDAFFHAASPANASFSVESMVNDRWAGRRE